jgi:hypothetical protein
MKPAMSDPPPACPNCKADPTNWIGVEIPGVYDGVLYWQCQRCGSGMPRAFAIGSRLRGLSIRAAGRHKDGW